MEDLTLDMCVLMTGSGKSDCGTNLRFCTDCLNLMKRMIDEDRYRLALDKRGKIRLQYDKLKPDTFGHYFVRQMATMEKTVPIPWSSLSKGVKVQLETRGFTENNEDYKFVVVASGTCCKKIVSHEPHFFDAQDILATLDIRVMLPTNA